MQTSLHLSQYLCRFPPLRNSLVAPLVTTVTVTTAATATTATVTTAATATTVTVTTAATATVTTAATATTATVTTAALCVCLCFYPWETVCFYI